MLILKSGSDIKYMFGKKSNIWSTQEDLYTLLLLSTIHTNQILAILVKSNRDGVEGRLYVHVFETRRGEPGHTSSEKEKVWALFNFEKCVQEILWYKYLINCLTNF